MTYLAGMIAGATWLTVGIILLAPHSRTLRLILYSAETPPAWRTPASRWRLVVVLATLTAANIAALIGGAR